MKGVHNWQERLTFLESKINVETIIDVGVQECTPYLMKTFPDKKHVLFEMIVEWEQIIRKNYKDFNYDLYKVGLSDITVETWMVPKPELLQSSEKSKHLNFRKFRRKIDYCRLDDIITNEQEPYLIKIDVDGDELKVLTGALGTLLKASVVIVEGRLHGPINMLSIMNFMSGLHFKLWDMFNLMYHDEGQLEQCELVFLRIADYNKASIL